MNIPVLLLLAAVLAGIIALELRPQPADDSAMPPMQPRVSIPAPAGAGSASVAGPGTVATILARPLFSPNRRPPAPGAAAPVPEAPLPRVAGILIEGNRRSVIFAAAADGARPLVVNEGGQVNGFRVRSIEPGQVTLDGPDGVRTLRPSFDPRPPAAGTARPGPAPPNLDALIGIPGLPGLPGLPAPPPGPNAR